MKYLVVAAAVSLAACGQPPTPEEERNSAQWSTYYQEHCRPDPRVCAGGFIVSDNAVYRIMIGETSTATPPLTMMSRSLDDGTGRPNWRFENVTDIAVPNNGDDDHWARLAVAHAAQFVERPPSQARP